MSHAKAAKNANGLGSIRKQSRKRADGSRYEYWEARITIGYNPTTNKQIQKTLTGKTQSAVIEKMKNYGFEAEVSTPSIDSLSLQSWLEIWKAEYLISVKPSTAYLYERDIELYILPHLGRYKLDELSSSIIQKFYNRLLHPTDPTKKPLASKTVKDIHGVLHQALEQAVMNDEIDKNPSEGCKLPKVQKKAIQPMEDSQLASFLNLIEGHVHEYLYKITLFTGLRESEVLGLTWDCVDLSKGELVIRQQLRKEQKKGGEYYFSSPKNGKVRVLSISPTVIQLLKFQKCKQQLQRAEAETWKETNLVFTNAVGDRLSYRTAYDCFKRVVKKMGLPNLRFHDLRHQYAVISLKNGDDIKTVQNNLGHATASFTLDVYGHVTDEMRKASAIRMESYIQNLGKM